METFDYIVIGSGPGGGPLAANLALAGFRVLVLEAGEEPRGPRYEVPAFHALATEDEAIRWDYYVDHSGRRTNVWYPRAAAVGGCAAHNAMITIAPPDCDWDHIAGVTGDESWCAEHMRHFFTRLEKCGYRSRWSGRSSGHGFDGWLSTETADTRPALRDTGLLRLLHASGHAVRRERIGNNWLRMARWFDPNDRRLWGRTPAGIASTPMATRRARRVSPRERLREVQKTHSNLTIRAGALATRILFDEERRARGVEYVEGRGLYWAGPDVDRERPLPERRVANAAREVILSAGAFNSPQLLMLSGIGGREELEAQGIETVVDLPGVGKNLQDHYEISVVSRMRQPFRILRQARFDPDGGSDPPYEAWLSGRGAYSSSGCVMGILYQSKSADPKDGPDLYIFGVPADFRGYEHGYSRRLIDHRDRFSWIVLKGRMQTAAGSVRLASPDPRCPPRIDFAYFPEGDPGAERDMSAMIEGIRLVQRINRRVGRSIDAQLWPPVETAGDEELRQFIRDHAWSHHAACTNAMGRREDGHSVVDSRFQVHGTKGLRVVDASVFPRIPGHFISAAIYMLSERASDDILK